VHKVSELPTAEELTELGIRAKKKKPHSKLALHGTLPRAAHLTVVQYNETNVIHFSFSLLRIKGLYMFRALLAHPQEVLHKQHLVYCVRIMSVGCGTVSVSLQP
jgi:hypothetical protein